ncbi:EamA family transporter [Flavilitoribacter nigricans DSM 23189 = NBRC 102662]|uniref:EamA family transporter n=2 Tax=Flavilitoribacter TaxID=2762562 RepID=A0A2D0NEG3_FLAN2|nr:EamA family transporter [Flavilitoribacter nigricans DSM 23189 = NBRC 102662]
MLLSILAFTVMNAFVKYLQDLPPFEIVFFRALGTLILCLILLRARGISLVGDQVGWLIGRGIAGTISMLLFFMAVKEIPFGSAVSLRYLSPIFAGILAVTWLKERITAWQWMCFFLAFSGVLLLKGFDTRINLIGLSYILTSAFFSGVVYVLIRRIGLSKHPLVIITYFMGCATAIGGLLSLFNWQTPRTQDWWILVSLGVFGFFGQLFMTKAYQVATVGTVAPMKYLEAIFALLIGWIWFGETYGPGSLLGIALVIGGMLLNIFGTRRE